ncbi:unnamed protein product [Orchesella dallaii]|uniref:Protein sleepless n=1 Tax=Orchesella dallaii TaxID=48710 RepID=A0ABP1RM43_9HEXA
MANKIVAAFFTLLVFVATAEALKCYSCQYVDGTLPPDVPVYSEESCETGQTPKEEFSEDCSRLEYIPDANGKLYGVPKSTRLLSKKDNYAKAIVPSEATNDAAYSCVQITMDGTFLYYNENLNVTVRSCLLDPYATQPLPDKCYANELSKLAADIEEPLLVSLIEEYEDIFEETTDAGICSCSTDNCN